MNDKHENIDQMAFYKRSYVTIFERKAFVVSIFGLKGFPVVKSLKFNPLLNETAMRVGSLVLIS